jgi:Ca2+-binding RTX toxin-like protein
MATKLGNAKNNKLDGTSLKDQLFGQSGNDTLKGLSGNDVLVGGKGNDILAGGKGNDTFVFAKGDGKDTVTDFNVKQDILQIAYGTNNIKTVAGVVKHAESANKGKDTVIDLGGGNKITLKDVALKDFIKDPSGHIVVN